MLDCSLALCKASLITCCQPCLFLTHTSHRLPGNVTAILPVCFLVSLWKGSKERKSGHLLTASRADQFYRHYISYLPCEENKELTCSGGNYSPFTSLALFPLLSFSICPEFKKKADTINCAACLTNYLCNKSHYYQLYSFVSCATSGS